MDAVLFDFFGTLVDYQPDRSQLAAPRTHEIVRSLGYAGTHDSFVEAFDAATASLEASSRRSLREFSMADAAAEFCRLAQFELADDEIQQLADSYVGEWSRHVRPVAGVQQLIGRLAEEFTVAVVSNTHDPTMVPNLLDEMGVSDAVSTVVLSVDHGWAKPHPSIYAAALERIDCSPERALFVGDNYEADYVGPTACNMRALLIDPAGRHDVPHDARINSVLDVVGRI